MKISDALNGYCLQLEADGRSRHTVAQARRHVRSFIQHAGNREVETVRPEDLAAFLASSLVTKRADGGPRRPTSANALRSSLRCFFGFCHAAGYSNMNPARLVRRARCPAPRPRGVNDHDAALLLAALDGARTVAEKRDCAMFRLMLGVGLRVGSAIALDIADVKLDAAELRVRVMKNQDQDVVYLTDDLVALLRSYLGDRTDGPLFPRGDGERIGARQVGRRLELWSERAGIAHANPHALRHRFAQQAYARTGDVLLVGRMLCHRSVASTATYARPTEARVRAAMG